MTNDKLAEAIASMERAQKSWVKEVGQPIPPQQDHSRGNKPPRPWDKGVPLSQQVAMWPTPSVRDHKDTGDLSTSQFRKDGKERNDTLGRVAYGSTTQTESKGSLNPAFPCWLMGYTTEWESCADMVTLSSRKSQRNS